MFHLKCIIGSVEKVYISDFLLLEVKLSTQSVSCTLYSKSLDFIIDIKINKYLIIDSQWIKFMHIWAMALKILANK